MEPEEFNRIIIPMRGELKELARKMTGDDDNADDMVQEVMLKLWSMRQSLDEYDSKKALAVTILKNKINDRWRHGKLESGKEVTGEEYGGEDLSAERTDEINLIRIIVEHLPPLQRQIFRLKEIEGYDNTEIISITGCSPESLRQNLSRARRKIREDFIRLTAMRMSIDKSNEKKTE